MNAVHIVVIDMGAINVEVHRKDKRFPDRRQGQPRHRTKAEPRPRRL